MIMKIGKFEITEGPNAYWYFAAVGFTYASITTGNWWWICGWFIFNAALIPICLRLHTWNEKKQKLHDKRQKDENIT